MFLRPLIKNLQLIYESTLKTDLNKFLKELKKCNINAVQYQLNDGIALNQTKIYKKLPV